MYATRTSQVTRKLNNKYVELVRGDGYWYFVYSDVARNIFDSESVYTMRLNDLTVAHWVEIGEKFISRIEAEHAKRA